MQSICRQVLFVFVLVASALGTAPFQPTFGHPYIFPDRIVFTSVDRSRLIGIDKKGTKRWEIQFSERIYEQPFGDASMLVQEGRRVFKINVADGSRADWLKLPRNQLLLPGADDSFIATTDSRPNHPRFRVLDPGTHKPLWESSKIESIEHVLPEMLITVVATRVPEGNGYHLQDVQLTAIERLSGRSLWSLPITEGMRSASLGRFIAVSLQRKSYDVGHPEQFLILDRDTGKALYSQYGNYLNFWSLNDSLAVLEGVFGEPGEAQLYFCTPPACHETRVEGCIFRRRKFSPARYTETMSLQPESMTRRAFPSLARKSCGKRDRWNGRNHLTVKW